MLFKNFPTNRRIDTKTLRRRRRRILNDKQEQIILVRRI
jgi:hypothetical protein